MAEILKVSCKRKRQVSGKGFLSHSCRWQKKTVPHLIRDFLGQKSHIKTVYAVNAFQ